MPSSAFFDEQTLQTLTSEQNWQEIVRLTDDLTLEQKNWDLTWYFRGLALLKLGRGTEAITAIDNGLLITPAAEWGNQLAFEAHLAQGNIDHAFDRFGAFIRSNPNHERQKAYYVEKAAELDLFEIASKMNERRWAICASRTSPKYALAVQCFAKPDTLSLVFRNLLRLHNAKELSLVIIVDACDADSSQILIDGNLEVHAVISESTARLYDCFFSIEFIKNETNLGTAPTCRRVLDYVASRYEGFLFIEDDCLLAPAALDWVRYHLVNTLSLLGSWFCTCESIFFDSQEREISLEARDKLTALSSKNGIKGRYVNLDFVPSTCFGTTSEIWKLCASVRSFTKGPESLTRFMRSINRRVISPVVPLASDIGVRNDRGYSTVTLGRENVRERKSTILLDEGQFDKESQGVFDGDTSVLYSATSLLNLRELNNLDGAQ